MLGFPQRALRVLCGYFAHGTNSFQSIPKAATERFLPKGGVVNG